MAEETQAQPEPQSGQSPLGFTPRKGKRDGGLINQTELREDIAKAMHDEMLTCSVDGFLEKLAPFSPDAAWVDNAYDRLMEKGILETSGEPIPPAKPTREGTRKSARIREAPTTQVEDAVPEVDTENAGVIRWTAYPDTTLGQNGMTEMQTFQPLEEIVKALGGCPDPNPDPDSRRKSNGYSYKDCPYNEMKSEILGAGFRVDAVISNPAIYEKKGEEISLAAAQTAVAMEFKKVATPEMVYKNRQQLVGAANHIMNDDPRRNWMYGVTIENTNMSLWYFSRSYSMKSDSFDFTKDFKTFIRVFLSFLYANDEELGHDPSIHRKFYNDEWCYVYELKTEKGPKYYRTIELLYGPRFDCITGRKSRVWKVIEVPSLKKLQPPRGRHEVVLKDCWVDGGSLSEKEIQMRIFKRLNDVREADYAWAPLELKAKLKDGLTHPETYFMKVELDWKEDRRINKDKPEYRRAPTLLACPEESSYANPEKVIRSSQTSTPTTYPSSSAFNTSQLGSDAERSAPKKRDYKVKQHYRVVYADVGESLAQTTIFHDVIRAFEDVFVALTLLYLARWVHRDVSAGNIILVRNRHGVRGKLSDLEYARDFNEKSRMVSTDPKTGTPYFMPLEIHSGDFLLPELPSPDENPLLNWNDSGIETITPSLTYIFIHDLESLWWIIVWILLKRVVCSKPLEMCIFTMGRNPHRDRRRFFLKGKSLSVYLQSVIHDLLCSGLAHKYLYVYNATIYKFYVFGKREGVASYEGVYSTLWDATYEFVTNMAGVNVELRGLSDHSQADPQELGKRTRSIDAGNVADRRGSIGGPSQKKKRKAGEDSAE